MTADELRAAQDQYERDRAQYEQSRRQRNEKVREALREEWSHAAIARATGLTRGRINQLKETT